MPDAELRTCCVSQGRVMWGFLLLLRPSLREFTCAHIYNIALYRMFRRRQCRRGMQGPSLLLKEGERATLRIARWPGRAPLLPPQNSVQEEEENKRSEPQLAGCVQDLFHESITPPGFMMIGVVQLGRHRQTRSEAHSEFQLCILQATC